jgi:hypothetical protein
LIHRGVALAAALLAVGCSLGAYTASRRLEREIARIRAAGEPLSFPEHRARCADAAGADAAPDYRAAVASVAGIAAGPLGPLYDLLSAYRAGLQRCPLVPPSDDVRRRARAAVAKARPVLDRIDLGAEKPSCRYAFHLESGEIPGFVPLHVAGLLLSLRTLELVVAGEGDRAADSLVSKLRMLRVFETEPVVITHLVRLAAWRQAAFDLPAVLGAEGLSGAALDRLDDALARAEAPDLLRRTIEGERLWTMAFSAAILGPDWPAAELRLAGAERRPPGERRRLLRDACDHVAVTGAMADAAARPWPEVQGAMAAAVRTPPPFSTETSTRLDAQLKLDVVGRVLAATRAGRVAIAVERHRRRHGNVPTSLADTASPRPEDPFTGGELVYRVSEDGFAIISVGPDAGGAPPPVDDAGRPLGVRVCLRDAAS